MSLDGNTNSVHPANHGRPDSRAGCTGFASALVERYLPEVSSAVIKGYPASGDVAYLAHLAGLECRTRIYQPGVDGRAAFTVGRGWSEKGGESGAGVPGEPVQHDLVDVSGYRECFLCLGNGWLIQIAGILKLPGVLRQGRGSSRDVIQRRIHSNALRPISTRSCVFRKGTPLQTSSAFRDFSAICCA